MSASLFSSGLGTRSTSFAFFLFFPPTQHHSFAYSRDTPALIFGTSSVVALFQPITLSFFFFFSFLALFNSPCHSQQLVLRRLPSSPSPSLQTAVSHSQSSSLTHILSNYAAWFILSPSSRNPAISFTSFRGRTWIARGDVIDVVAVSPAWMLPRCSVSAFNGSFI